MAEKSAAQPALESNAKRTRAEQRVRIRAARLRIITDQRLGKPTPQWVRELAKKPL